LIEFTLAGIALTFIWISTAQMALGMWNYHTLQYAAKTTAAYASIHGASCTKSPNSCSVTVGDVATIFQNAALGVPMDRVVLTLTTASGAVTTCNPVSTCSSNGAWGSTWPSSANKDNAVGKDIYIRADYAFQSALALFIPGHGSVDFGSSAGAGAFDFPAYSHQVILF
jgi:hypothetical protein